MAILSKEGNRFIYSVALPGGNYIFKSKTRLTDDEINTKLRELNKYKNKGFTKHPEKSTKYKAYYLIKPIN